jgi:hypothetical protein
MPLWVPAYESFHGSLGPARELLLQASAAMMDWLLWPVRAHLAKACGATNPGTLLCQQIPARGVCGRRTNRIFLELARLSQLEGVTLRKWLKISATV